MNKHKQYEILPRRIRAEKFDPQSELWPNGLKIDEGGICCIQRDGFYQIVKPGWFVILGEDEKAEIAYPPEEFFKMTIKTSDLEKHIKIKKRNMVLIENWKKQFG